MRTERLTSCFELLQKLRARLESHLTGLSPNIYYGSLQCGTSDFVHCVACFGFIFVLFSPSMCFYDIGSDGMSFLFGLEYVSCTMSRENNSLNKGDVYNCRLYVKIEIETRVCVQVVRMIRCSCSFPLFLWWQVN